METKFQLRQIECNLKKTKNPVALKRFYRDNKLNLNTKSKSVDFNAVKTEYPPIKFVTQVSLASSKENQNLNQIYDLNSTIESGKTNLNPLDKEKIYKKLQREYSFVKNTNHTSSNVPLMYLSKSIRTNWNKNKSLLNSANDGLSREMKNSYSRTIIQLKSQGGSKLPSLNNSWRSVIENLNKMTTVRNLKLSSHFKIK